MLPWHENDSDVRVLVGPNRGGKTTAGAFELVSIATGHNPIREVSYPTPNLTWAVCLTLKDQGKIMKRKLFEMLPRKSNGSPNWRFYKQDSLIVLGRPYLSEIYIKTQEDGPERLYGEGCHGIWVDEEKPGEMGEACWNELYARRIPGQRLMMFVTFTPLNGRGWAYRKLWDEKSPDFLEGTHRTLYTINDCLVERGGFWTEKEVTAFKKNYPDYEIQARFHGEFTSLHSHPFFSPRELLKALETAPRGERARVDSRVFGRPLVVPGEGPLTLYRPRESGHQYIASWDPAAGVGQDRSAFTIIDRADLSVVLECVNATMDPEYFARTVVAPCAQAYNDALLVWEVNGQSGGMATACLRDYRNCYFSKTWDKMTSDITDKLGWRTTGTSHGGGTRQIILDSLQRTLRERTWGPSYALLEEMSHVVVKENKVEHEEGFHDDLTMATGIALAVHFEEPLTEYPDLEKLRVKYHKRQDEGTQQRVFTPRYVLSGTGAK